MRKFIIALLATSALVACSQKEEAPVASDPVVTEPAPGGADNSSPPALVDQPSSDKPS